MHWISKDEKEIIKEWAKEYGTSKISMKYFPMPTAMVESYWNTSDNGNSIVEYEYENIPELKKLLEQELQEDFYKDLILPLAIAIFKEKKINCQSLNSIEEDRVFGVEKNDFKIPEYVYVF